MGLEFKKKKEDFVCENCGELVKGDGYTNHCPKCLWSKHVDVNPGDRLSKCGGMMEPIYLDWANGMFSIIHKCLKCGHIKRNIASPDDNIDLLIDKGKC
ncbi:MAG: RNHCP domain-containing protein [Candidatus Colwellbacteria bacterium]|jgi:hypothetical protein|nr:RNHCP domain-containing protein [Candidatus Colwellbacteria bacterium]MDD3752678.1 RNHCP domain-containing protein [Candidatus Colwellbacteria bacterium]MDD4818932.1 RNHCP domain-containing protein [Candidatus Colwellbacteria bacterium]